MPLLVPLVAAIMGVSFASWRLSERGAGASWLGRLAGTGIGFIAGVVAWMASASWNLPTLFLLDLGVAPVPVLWTSCASAAGALMAAKLLRVRRPSLSATAEQVGAPASRAKERAGLETPMRTA